MVFSFHIGFFISYLYVQELVEGVFMFLTRLTLKSQTHTVLYSRIRADQLTRKWTNQGLKLIYMYL